MATDYEKFFQHKPHGLGEPTKEFVAFFDTYAPKHARVLDVGCGQGRDSLFIARLGHSVTAVDLSPSGIRQLNADAKKQGLRVRTEVADIRNFAWGGPYDVIVINRTLHMLLPEERIAVLLALLESTRPGTHVLIADERSNLPAFKAVIDDSAGSWAPTLEHRGFLFTQRK